MSRKLEEAQAKLEDNESARKRLQNRLEGLNRQMEEGQGDRERLVEQLESLRGQVRGTLRVEEKQNSLFPVEPAIKCIVMPPNSKTEQIMP